MKDGGQFRNTDLPAIAPQHLFKFRVPNPALLFQIEVIVFRIELDSEYFCRDIFFDDISLGIMRRTLLDIL